MPRDLSVRSALDLIASTKITERQEGLELLTEICSNPYNCKSLQNTPDGTGWLQVFQCMFVLVKTERAAALKSIKTSKGQYAFDTWSGKSVRLKVLSVFSCYIPAASCCRQSSLAGRSVASLPHK
jgi:hypothetical protein